MRSSLFFGKLDVFACKELVWAKLFELKVSKFDSAQESKKYYYIKILNRFKF
jgi:hypothetical protein